ncbi:MAG TPA: DNA-processing protein DprA [Gaiellaceae bacterium]|jgi:DNA processing protein
MSDLAVVAFAAESGSHLLRAPRDQRFAAFARTFDESAYRARLAEQGFRWIARADPAFPARLAAIHDPPLGLFVRGNGRPDLLQQLSVAIVGARACSPYGEEVATSFARAAARAGVVVVSGLARGVDGAAHRGALDEGLTVAVLGCGIDRDYPSAHAALAARIAERGLVVSEYPPGVEPAPWRFPARNRIVAGLAAVTLVVEARERSGALITADLALEEGREVLAVPGEITSQLSQGTNGLLRLGATPATSVADLLEALGVDPDEAAAVTELEPPLAAVHAAVVDAAATVDELVRRTGLDAAWVAASLAELELLGLVAQAEGRFRGVMS